MSFCKHCVSGVRHEGTPAGKYETIGGIKTYVATPTVDYPKDKAILFLTDVFGHELENSRLLADDFAKNGFQVFLPDLFNGDPIPVEAMEKGSFDLSTWFPRHGSEQTRARIDPVVAALKERGVTKFGATGYCFGARYVFDLAFEHAIHVSVVAHPSLLQVEDLEKYTKTATAPLLINSCEVDGQFPAEKQARADELFGDGKFAPGYERKYWDGCTHGFSVRGDMSDPKVKAGKEGAFKASVEWFLKYL